MISSKVIFDWKVDQFGWPTKAKARLVARDDMQREYIDFGDLYAPTVASSSVRLLAALACEHDLELCHFDIDQAFCEGRSCRGCLHAIAGRMWFVVGKGCEAEQESLRFETGIQAVVCVAEEVSFGFGVCTVLGRFVCFSFG